MAKETQNKKRKASAPEADIEKVKKVKAEVPVSEVQAKKRKAVEEASSPVVKKSKAPKTTEVAPKPKPAKKTKAVEKTDEEVMPTSISKASKKVNGAGASKKKAKEVISTEPISTNNNEDEVMAENVDDGSDSDSEVDDQTEALLKGFESDDDEEMVGDDGLKEGQEVPLIPKEKLSKTQKRQLEEAKNDETPGVVYVGRIPHGFYENEMRQYFKQFGTIVNLRLSRNRKTGASKHYAFIQFESKTVSDIVAKAMDNYLLFGHILKVKSVTDEQLSPDIWKGANKRFKKVPWNKLEGRSLNQGASEEKWDERVSKEQQKRLDKAEKLKAIGYEYEIPVIKSAKGVAKIPEITNGEEEIKAVEDTVEAVEPTSEDIAKTVETAVVPKSKGKKGKAAKKAEVEVVKEIEVKAVEVEVPIIEETIQAKPKKEKKGKTVKAVVETISQEVDIVTPVEPAAVEEAIKPKAKKEKKPKVAKVVTETVVEEIEPEIAVEEPKPKAKKEKKAKVTKVVTETIVEEIVPAVAEEETKPKPKKQKKQKIIEVVAEVDVPADVTAEVPEKKLKTKKSKTTLVEKAVVPEEAVVEKIKKVKKAKKASA